MSGQMGPFDDGSTVATKEILVILDLADDDTTPVIKNVEGQLDVVEAGHGRIRWTPVWSERALKRFYSKARPDGSVGWLPFARIADVVCRNKGYLADLLSLPGEAPPRIVPHSQEEPAAGCSFVQPLKADVPIANAISQAGFTVTLEWRHPVQTSVNSQTFENPVNFKPRPSGQTDELPRPTAGHRVGATHMIPIVVQQGIDGQVSTIWNACTELDEVIDDVTRVTWIPLRREADFLEYSRQHNGTLLETTLEGIGFASDADANRVFQRDPVIDPATGSLTLEFLADAATTEDLDLTYTLFAKEEELNKHTAWDPTIKVKPRTPPAPPSSSP